MSQQEQVGTPGNREDPLRRALPRKGSQYFCDVIPVPIVEMIHPRQMSGLARNEHKGFFSRRWRDCEACSNVIDTTDTHLICYDFSRRNVEV
jgi:hypothetical protein